MSREIQNDEDLILAVLQASQLIQNITDYIGPEDPVNYDSGDFLIRFPRGYISTVESLKQGLPKNINEVLLRNISYSLQLTDFYAWHLNRTDVNLTLKQMILKNGIVTYCSIMESLLHQQQFQLIARNKSFPQRQKMFVNRGLITQDLSDQLNGLWKKRQGIHLYILTEPEHNQYSYEDYNSAATTVKELIDQMKRWG